VNDTWLRAAVGVLWFSSALILASGAFAALLHMLPGLHQWPGVSALAIVLATGCAVLAWRVLFDRGRRS
jgi:Flp pilus assembly protein TadB